MSAYRRIYRFDVLAAAQTPPKIVARLAAALHRTLQNAEVKQRLAAQDIEVAVSAQLSVVSC